MCAPMQPRVATASAGSVPFTMPGVIAVAEAIPFKELTDYDVERLICVEGRSSFARSRSRDGNEDADLYQAAFSAWRTL